jgi:hypothetical protein
MTIKIINSLIPSLGIGDFKNQFHNRINFSKSNQFHGTDAQDP